MKSALGEQKKIPVRSWITVFVILILSNSLWISTSIQKQKALHHETDVHTYLYLRSFDEKIDERIDLIKVLQGQWVNVENESKLYCHERFSIMVPPFWDINKGNLAISWINASGIIKWVYPTVETTPPINISIVYDDDGTFNEGFRNAQETGNVSVRFTENLVRGGVGYTVYYPLIWNNSISGYFALVFRVSELIREEIHNSPDLDFYSIYIFGNQTEIFHSGESFDLNGKFSVLYSFSFYGHSWDLYFSPLSEHIRAALPYGNLFFLSLGFTIPIFAIIAEYAIIAQKRKTNKSVLEKETLKNKLLDSERDKLLILDNLKDNVIYYESPDLTIKWANITAKNAFSTILYQSYNKKDDLGIFNQKCYHIWYGKSNYCVDCPVIKTFQSKKENGLIKKSQDGKIWRIQTFPVFDDVHNIVGVVEIMIDITLQKKMEENLRQSQKMDAIGRLAGGIAHDFNNILTVINGYSNLILDQMDDKLILRDGLQEISRAGKQGESLTQQLLQFSRKQILHTKVFDLNTLIKNMSQMLQRLIGENIECDFKSGYGEYKIEADAGQIEQIIMNLVINARDAMLNGGTLSIETQNYFVDEDRPFGFSFTADPGLYVLLTVSDTGMGMNEEIQEHIFEPFFTTKDVGKGTGLGLSTVFGIVKKFNGFITVESEVDKGSIFNVFLPQINKPLEKIKTEEPVLYNFKGPKTVLLVEDNEFILKYSRKLLETHNFTVLTARDGMEALNLYHKSEEKIDLVISDIIMPKMSGVDLIKEINDPNLKVLLISGYSPDSIKIPKEIINANRFLQKPFTSEQFLQKVDYIFGQEVKKE
jgi:signal transduction histidine kinase/CheY-like chemotaxis protein